MCFIFESKDKNFSKKNYFSLYKPCSKNTISMCQRNKNTENKHVSLNCYFASFFLFSAIYNYIRKSKINCQPKSEKDNHCQSSQSQT